LGHANILVIETYVDMSVPAKKLQRRNTMLNMFAAPDCQRANMRFFVFLQQK